MTTSNIKRVFLSYHGGDESASDVLARTLRERGFEVFRDRDSLAPGKLWPEQLERALVETDAIVVCVGPDGLGSWQKREIYLALDRQARGDNLPVISLLLPGAEDPPLGFLRLDTWVDMRQGIDHPDALHKLFRAVRGESPLSHDITPDPRSTVCPYRGLELFREEDAPFFFGREDLVKRLADKVRQTPVTALLGPSGSGKSSLVQAGLLPILHKDSTTHWHVMTLRPSNDPLVALIDAFDPPPNSLGRTERLAYLNNAAMHLRRGEVHFRQLAESMLASLPSTGRLLLVIDQWEELYTQASRNNSQDDVARFVALVFEASQVERFHGLLVLRTDFYEEASRHPGMPQFLANHQVPVEAIQRKGLERAIIEPAAGVGLRLEEGLLERLLDDVGDEPGNLPLLEHALHQLWLQRRGSLLTFDAYRKIGGVQGAIAEQARQAYVALQSPEQIAARRLLVSLVIPGEDGKDTRARVLFPEDVHEREVVRRFASAENRLLVTGRDPYGRATIEVSHEALIRGWSELRNWVGESLELLQIRQRIKLDMMHWEVNRRSPSLLLPRGIRLEEARKLLNHGQQVIIDDLRPYIRTSLRRDAARRWAVYAVTGILLGFTSFAAVYFYNLQLQEAEARTAAEQAQMQAETALHRAIETDGRRLAQIARRYLESGQPHRAIMVAREAFGPLQKGLPLVERPYVPQAVDVLHRAMAARPILRKVFRGHTWVVNMAAFSPDGQYIATAGVDGRVFILDAQTLAVERLIIPNPETFKEEVHSPDENVNWVAFSPNGEQLATANEDGSVRIFNVRDGKEVLRYQAHTGGVDSLSFTPDGLTLLTTASTTAQNLNEHQARLWNAADGTLVRNIINKSDCCIKTGVVSPEGSRAAIVENNAISIRDLKTGKKLVNIGGGRSFPRIQSLAFSPDGERLATGDNDKLVHIWDARKGTELLALRGHEGIVGSVTFSPDGRYLVTTDVIGSASKALIWDVQAGKQIASLLGYDVGSGEGIRYATFSLDGRFIVTAAMDHTVRLWEFAHPDPARLLQEAGNPKRFTFSPDGTLITASNNDAVLIWHAGQEKAVRLGDHDQTVASFSPDSSRLVVVSESQGNAYLYDTKTFEQLFTFSPVLTNPFFSVEKQVQFSPDGSKIVAISGKNEDGRWNSAFARIWDAKNGQELAFLGPHDNFHDLAFVGKGDRVMTAGGSFIRFWNAANGSELAQIRVREGNTGMVNAATSPNGSIVVSGSIWNRAAVWDTNTGNLVTELKGAREKTFVHGFTPDGQYVVTGDDVGTVGLWHARSGQLVRTIQGPETGTLLEISVPRQRLLAVGKDLTLRVWDVETGALLFFTDLVPYRTKNLGVPKEMWRASAILHPAGDSALVHLSPGGEPGLVFNLPYKNFAEVIEAAYAAVSYRFTEDERTELELDLFGQPDLRAANFEPLTVEVRH